nr:integrase, catalytic region, zinc finger, CCHC-type, peptidase aspartic, catalytic [Tanacetum cinerariifolium]
MYYPRFTKVIIHHFMTKKPSIPRQNRVDWHYVRDDILFSTIKVVSRHQNTQQYGAILPIELTTEDIRNTKAYKEYYACATGEAAPKPKASARKEKGGSTSSTTPPTPIATPTPTTTVKKKGSSSTSNVDLSSVSHSKLNKDVKRYSRKDLLSYNNSHLGETSSAYDYNDAMNVSCNSILYDSFDENNLFIFDDVSVKNSPVSKMYFKKKPRDSMNVRSKSNSNKSLPRTVHWWLPKMQPLAKPIAKWILKVKRCSKHMMGNRSLLTNFVEKFLRTVHFGNNDFAMIVGYGDVVIGSMTIKKVYYVEGLEHNLFSIGQFCDKGIEVAFRKSTCFVRNEDGVHFLTGDHSSNLYTIALNEVASNSSTCLLAKASSSQSWLWHQLQHVRTDNGTEFKNKTLAKFFDEVGITQQFSAVRTPQQNGVVKRRNRTLVEAARTMLTFANLPLFLWAETVATACFTQNHVIFSMTMGMLESSRTKRILECLLDIQKSLLLPKFTTNKLIMKSSKTNVETSNVELPSNEEEVFHESSESFQEESSSSSLNDDVQQSSEEVGVLSSNTQSVLNNMVPNVDEASTTHNVFNEHLEDAYFDASTSFHDPSNVYTFYQRYRHEKKWTKDHPLHKIIGDPKSSVRTRGQLANSYLFSCLLSYIEPANVAETLRDADWQGGSSTDEGTGSKPGVPDVPSDDSKEEISWNSSDDEDVDDQTKGRDDNEGLRISEEERMHEEKEADELYRDVDINQGRGLQVSQDIDDSHVTLTPVHSDGQQESSSTSSFVTSLLNPIIETCMESIFTTGSYFVTPIPSPKSTMTPSIIMTTTTASQPPIPPTPIPSDILQTLPTFVSVFRFEDRVKSLEINFSEFMRTNQSQEAVSNIPDRVKSLEVNFSEFMRTNQSEEAVSNIPGILHQYMHQEMTEVVREAVQIQTDQLQDSLQRENDEFLKTIDDNMKKIIKEQVKSQVKAQFTRILPRAATLKRRREEDDDQEGPSVGLDRGSKRRREGGEHASASTPSEPATGSAGRYTTGTQSRQLSASESAFVEEPVQTTCQMEEPSHLVFETGAKDQPIIQTSQHPEWFSQPRKPPTPDRDWNKTLPTPLSLIPDNRGRHVIPFEHFINNDLEYLRGGASSQKYTTSMTKTKAADYGYIKWIKDLVPRTMWIREPLNYNKHALWGVSHWGRKRQHFYGFAVNRESTLDVYSKRRIIAVTDLKIVEWHNYKHLDWISAATMANGFEIVSRSKKGAVAVVECRARRGALLWVAISS